MKTVKPIYRRFDKVRVITPRVFVRCGYPMGIESAREEIRAKDKGQIVAFADSFGVSTWGVHSKIVNALAYGLLQTKGFGGPNRTIHTRERPEIAGRVCRVAGKRVVKTGIYRGGCSDPEDSEGPSLRKVKTHTILELDWQDGDFNYDHFEIEAENVELVTDTPNIW